MSAAVSASALATSSFVFAAAAVAAQRRRSLLAPLEPAPPSVRRRARPALPTRPLLGVAVIAAGLIGHRAAGIVGSVAASVLVLSAPVVLRRRRVRRRERAIQDRMPDAISVIASGLRSGRSLVQSIELAARDVEAPLGPSFGALADRIQLGEPADAAISGWANVVGGSDARLAAGILMLHRQTGGSLAVTLEDLAGTLRARRSAAREVGSLTAQARLSAAILGFLPLGFFLFLSVVARQDLQAAYETSAGVTAVCIGLGLQAAAYVWIRRLLRIEP